MQLPKRKAIIDKPMRQARRATKENNMDDMDERLKEAELKKLEAEIARIHAETSRLQAEAQSLRASAKWSEAMALSEMSN